MGSSSYPLLFIFFLSFAISSHARLKVDYYAKTCPQFPQIIREAVVAKQTVSPTTAAATLRVFFHDCMVNGCDASVLIASTRFNQAERDAEDNINLPGDAFDVVTRAKTHLELTCPGVVSCADILAQTTRDLIKMVGGPFYEVRLGRKDSFISNISHVHGMLPNQKMSMEEIIEVFKKKGFSIQEMVALIGSHTIGFSHCKEFASRIYTYNSSTGVDPTLNLDYANGLKMFCANHQANPSLAAFNDVVTPGTFDNMYYQNLKKGLGLLPIDRMMHMDVRTRPFAEKYAANQTEFFAAFSRAIEKLSRLEVKVGDQGEVRHRCETFNTINV